ncbi:MAG TPA: SDR family NAD(P)-dependent oxidoreductase [Candidatus Acidoferrales bacterium]|nr:SDR family NAD(P)-dependent oxidoreductase [Candidatus Acidoferrales bacterium]
MEGTAHRAIAIVGTGAILPDAPNVPTFWSNIKDGKYSITEVAPERWDPALYYDADPHAPDKCYSKIGGWVREYTWEPAKWRLAIPPCVVDAMDIAQRWAIACTRQALDDYGHPQRSFDPDRTAVILGNAMAGEKHYLTALRVYFPEYATELEHSSSFAALPEALRTEIKRELQQRIAKRLPEISEDTMPGELANCIAGRIANIFNLHGPNFVVDAACASAMAAFNAAVEGLIENEFDFAITGGIDRNMGASTFIKFCKIGALSATGTRPYGKGADGFVMGEGAVIFLLKRLADAERDGDHIYAVLRGIGGSSDGKGKGITAPNPVGQKLSIERAWRNAGIAPTTATLFEGHGTSTRVGDVVETQCLSEFASKSNLPRDSVALGSVKSNIGHLKGAAGAAGLLKAALALRDKVLPPSLNCATLNPDIDLSHSPIYVNSEMKPWDVKDGAVRSAGVSAFGFGGTNFHAVLEEYVPGRLNGNGKRTVAVTQSVATSQSSTPVSAGANLPGVGQAVVNRKPLRGALVMGADSTQSLVEKLRAIETAARSGRLPDFSIPSATDLRAPERVAIDYGDASELAEKAAKALKAFELNAPAVWQALRAQGIFVGKGAAGKVAFLYPGQGSQYVNMLATLCSKEPVVAEVFAEADRTLTPILGKPITEFIFVDPGNSNAVARAEEDLKQTAITQPTVLASDIALTRLFETYGIRPDMAMGHSLGEYGALVTSGVLSFADGLEAVTARGREMTWVAMKDNGKMAAVFAPLGEIERIIKAIHGYVVIANINSGQQAVIGGESQSVEQAVAAFVSAGFNAVPLPVSHAFHTSIVAPASEPLRRVLERLRLQTPRLPIVANVNGEFYPAEQGATEKILDILARQIASPVQFVKGLQTLYAAGARVFVEVGPKKALQGFVESVLGERGDTLALFTNHPKLDDATAFNQALCGLYAAGVGCAQEDAVEKEISVSTDRKSESNENSFNGNYEELGRFFAEMLEHGWQKYRPHSNGAKQDVPVVITGAALGLPGSKRIFDEENIARILRGEQFIDAIPMRIRHAMLDKHVTRLVKNESGAPVFETIDDLADVIKLAARGGIFDLEQEFGVASERVASMDRTTCLAIAAGIDALCNAGIPLVMRYKSTSKGTMLPERWGLPDALRDDTGVIFASAFPGYDSFARELTRYNADRARRDLLARLEKLRSRESNGHAWIWAEIDSQIEELRAAIEKNSYTFDRRFLFRVLSMGHSQFAELIGARGPNTQINSACASTTQAVSLAEDWIRAGRCRRVIVVSADDVTSDNLLEWMGAGFLASGAAATDDVVENAAIPFDKRRHGMVVGMGAAAMVLENADAARERGLQAICEVLSSVTANSAYHGTRLDQDHISGLMEKLVAQAEARHHISREQIAPKTVFVSHETYTPARGGSASAEIQALRTVFKDKADEIVIANTKGFTGHAMATGVEDVVAVKSLETACVPPVANFKQVDPELGRLNLSKGGVYPVEYALRLGAGFGSQISMTLMRWVPTKDGAHRTPNNLNYEYRIADRAAWDAWIAKLAGRPAAQLEVVKHTLRVHDDVQAVRPVATEATAGKAAVVAASASTAQAVRAVSTPSAKEATMAAPPASVPQKEKEVVLPPTPAAVAPPAVESSQQPQSASARAKAVAMPSEDAVKQRVLALVAEKTGYPIEMLDVDLDLEADLGVDTVKQAEVFATIRAEYGIQRDDTVKLRDFPTLAHVMRFVLERHPGQKSAEAAVSTTEPDEKFTTVKAQVIEMPAPVAPEPVVVSGERVKDEILAMVVEKTGYPSEMLDVDLDLEADLGVDTVKQAEMFAAIREKYNIPRDENRKLRDYPTLAHVIRFVLESRPDLATKAPQIKPGELVQIAAPIAEVTVLPLETEVQPVAAAPVSATDGESVKEEILAMVVEKTGYPKEMLDVDLDLEADLGIDTVKQAEMFAAIREKYNIRRDENRKLRDYPTLAHVVRFVLENRPDLAAEAAVSQAAPAPNQQEPITHAIDAKRKCAFTPRVAPASFEQADAVPRRVPVPVPRPPLEICKQTGVKLERVSRVIVMPDSGGVSNELKQRLETRSVEVMQLDPTSTEEVLAKTVADFMSRGPVQGVYWLPALDDEGDIASMTLESWHAAIRPRLKLFYTTMRTLCEQIASPGTFLVSATRLGGQHGYNESGASQPMGGAVVGFTKTYKREQLDVTVKAVDFELHSAPSSIADALIHETLRDNGAVEVGYKDGTRWSVALQEISARDGQPGLELNPETVFVVTGAAGSIVSAITADLANASGGIFYLLDLVPEPDPKNRDLERLNTDREALKRDLFARIQSRGERATPALVERELVALERGRAALDAITAVQNAGGTVNYRSVNLRDGDAVATIIDEIRARHGRVDVLLHAAGMERSHLLPFKEPSEFDLVFDVKADGWFNLLHAIGDMPIGATVAFSSIAGRFGNAGQTDYSSANDLLCKYTSNLRTTRPATRGIAIDWTAWAGIGMASRGSIPKMMEVAGIDMLAPEAGVPTIRRELTCGGTRGEVLVGQRLGILMNEWDANGGVDVSAAESALVKQGPMVGKIVAMSLHNGLTLETTLDPAFQPFLHDHKINGTPVLPGVMGVEAFAEAALCLLPGWHVESVEDVNFLAPFKFYRNEPRTIAVNVRFRGESNAIVADCKLIGKRSLPNQADPQLTTHFTARLRLTNKAAQLGRWSVPITKTGECVEGSDIYRVYFHGPAYQVLKRAWRNGACIIGELSDKLPDNHVPVERPLALNPRLIELCFQTAGLWEISNRSQMGLPNHIETVQCWGTPEQVTQPIFAVVTPDPTSGMFDADVVDAAGNLYLHLSGYRTVALPEAVDAGPLKALHAIAA